MERETKEMKKTLRGIRNRRKKKTFEIWEVEEDAIGREKTKEKRRTGERETEGRQEANKEAVQKRRKERLN